ncbi:MarR family transcriptional regulator [Halolamina rubra]|uniref:MarR family transcriptional regulator n=1 Tax=Halolamina rubra TaxID=1380430 RepID=UPI001F2996FC|nr:helix-turn-helix domain-containing protein [Halolamina rubra]
MSTATADTTTMRQPAEWMTPADDRILELIRDRGNLTPKAISDFGGPTRQYTSERCAKLAKYGLLEKVHHGLFGITDAGEAYLDEELDASELEPADDAE